MELQLVNFEQAKALKKLNFPIEDYLEEMVPVYTESGKFVYSDGLDQEDYFAPNLELVVKWLRDKKHIQLTVRFRGETWYYNIMSGYRVLSVGNDVETYEEALSAGIDKVLEIFK